MAFGTPECQRKLLLCIGDEYQVYVPMPVRDVACVVSLKDIVRAKIIRLLWSAIAKSFAKAKQIQIFWKTRIKKSKIEIR